MIIYYVSLAEIKRDCPAKWAGFLNFPEIALGVSFTSILGSARRVKTRHVANCLGYAVVVVGLFVLWQPLRAYSEWWIHFGSHAVYQEMVVAGVITLTAIILMFVIKDTGRTARRVAGLLGAGTVITSLASLIKPAWFQFLAGWFLELQPLYLALVYLAGTLIVFSIARFIAEPVRGAAR